MSIQALRERRSARAKEVRDYMDANKDGQWTKENQEFYDKAMREIEDLEGQIDRTQKVLDLDADERFKNVVREGVVRKGIEAGGPRDIFNRFLANGWDGLDANEIKAVRNTMSTTTPSQGGYTVPTEVATQVIDAIKAFGGMRQVADVFTTSQGGEIDYPTSDGTAEVGEIVAQNTAAASQDITFGSVPLLTYKFGSKIITVPIELIQDSNVDIEGFVVARIATRLGRIQNQKFTVGSGVGEPNGLFTAAAVGVVAATGGATGVIYDNLVDLQHSVDPGYRAVNKCKWMFADSTMKVIRKIKDDNGRPIFVPGYELQVPGGAPDTLLGDAVQINQDVPAMAANAKSIAYGDFSYYKIRDVMDLTMFRFTDSVYASKGQVGFLAWQRSGGNYTAAGTNGPVSLFQNSAT
jgi:HK97 family phage major capsid protein